MKNPPEHILLGYYVNPVLSALHFIGFLWGEKEGGEGEAVQE